MRCCAVSSTIARKGAGFTALENEYALRHFVSASVHAFFDPTSTCRLSFSAEAMVDPALKVRGTDRLRVADAPITPRNTAAYANASTIMIGRKCARIMFGNLRF